MLYTGSSRSLSTLELVVHRAAIQPSFEYKVMVISVPDDEGFITSIPQKSLPTDWRGINSYTHLQKLGSDWYQSRKSLLLKVPSAIIPLEYNFIINTNHDMFEKYVQLVHTEDYFWDNRLF